MKIPFLSNPVLPAPAKEQTQNTSENTQKTPDASGCAEVTPYAGVREKGLLSPTPGCYLHSTKPSHEELIAKDDPFPPLACQWTGLGGGRGGFSMPIGTSKYLEMIPTLEAFKYSMLTQRAPHTSH